MKLPGFVPEDLRQLARFVPTRGWDAVEWRPLTRSLRQISWQFVSGSGVKALGREVQEAVPGIAVLSRIDRDESLERVEDPEVLQQAGDELIRLYFSQWLIEDGLFLDLRPARLGWEDCLLFAPNGLWIQLRDDFREGMVALYRSFYSDDEQALDAALRRMGMLPDGLDPATEEELKGLLQAHFGVEQSAQRFSIDAFKESFDQLFEFFIEHDYTLHSDFVFVGFYLITLYLSLERFGQAHDVRAICSEVLLSGD